MVVFSFSQFKKYTAGLKGLPGYEPGGSVVSRFSNGEIYINVKTAIRDKDCLILGAITPPDEQLVSFLFLSHTLKLEGASRITAFLPYLAYTRQDKQKKGWGLGASAIAELFRAVHISEVVTMDLHSDKAQSLFSIPVHSLSPAKIFAREIKKLKLKKPTIVAPDEGALERCNAVAQKTGSGTEVVYMKKTRGAKNVRSVLYGQVSPNAIVVDDILDTGGTLLECCRILKDRGVKNIYIFVTHGLFTGHSWRKLFDFNVRKIYCTDSVPQVKDLKLDKLKVLPIRPLLEEYAAHLSQLQRKAQKVARKVERMSVESTFVTD